MKSSVRAVITMLLVALLGAALTAPPAAAAPRPDIQLNSVGSKYVGQGFKLSGSISDAPRGKKRIIVHKKKVGDSKWIKTKRKVVKKTDGRYVIHKRQTMQREGTFVFRVTLKKGKRVLDRDRIRVQSVKKAVAHATPHHADYADHADHAGATDATRTARPGRGRALGGGNA